MNEQDTHIVVGKNRVVVVPAKEHALDGIATRARLIDSMGAYRIEPQTWLDMLMRTGYTGRHQGCSLVEAASTAVPAVLVQPPLAVSQHLDKILPRSLSIDFLVFGVIHAQVLMIRNEQPTSHDCRAQ